MKVAREAAFRKAGEHRAGSFPWVSTGARCHFGPSEARNPETKSTVLEQAFRLWRPQSMPVSIPGHGFARGPE
jgi:hypothetical protein